MNVINVFYQQKQKDCSDSCKSGFRSKLKYVRNAQTAGLIRVCNDLTNEDREIDKLTNFKKRLNKSIKKYLFKLIELAAYTYALLPTVL